METPNSLGNLETSPEVPQERKMFPDEPKEVSHGGARPGSGPAKGSKHMATLVRKATQDAIRDYLKPELEGVFKSMVSRAKGVMVLDEKSGLPIYKYYPPDPIAAKLVIEYGAGKVVQPIAGDEDDGSLKIKVVDGFNYVLPMDATTTKMVQEAIKSDEEPTS